MFNYPLTFAFERFSFGRKIHVIDALEQPVLYIKQRALALKEVVDIYGATDKNPRLFQIKADRVIDYAAHYSITTASNTVMGTIVRHGMRSRWKAIYDTVQDYRKNGLDFARMSSIWNVTYTILDATGNEVGQVLEEIPLMKLVGTILREVFLVRPFLNPRYRINWQGKPVLYAHKQAAMFSRTFTLEKQEQFPEAEEGVLLSSLTMVLLIERTLGI